MCGISGIFLKKSKFDFNLPCTLKLMTDAIKHRGPDDEGYVFFNIPENYFETAGSNDTNENNWHSNLLHSPKTRIETLNYNFQLGLGHRRLSVIDLTEASHQPICDESSKIWLTLNGEIYNFEKIKIELINFGYKFFSKGDSEVVLNAYKHWGIDCLSKLNGMWSFVIFDSEKKILFGSRDRFGVKPLYYYIDDNYFAFASEHKAILKLQYAEIGINYNQVFNYLYINKVEIDDKSFFDNISELLPSHYFVYDLKNNSFKINKYYSLNYNPYLENFNQEKFEFYSQKTTELIKQAVESRLLSDINIGFCLSGGIDSSSIVCSADKLSKKNQYKQLGNSLSTFTAINSSNVYNEEKWAKIVSQKVDSNYNVAECTSSNLFEKLEEIIYYQDIPLLSTSTYAQYKVMEAASLKNIRVLIDGQGGDELFGGYAPFFCSFYFELLLNKKFNHLSKEILNINNSPLSLSVFFKAILKNIADKSFAEDLKISIHKLFKKESKYFMNEIFVKNISKKSFASDYKLEGTNNLMHYFFTDHFLKNLLRWEDRCSMAFSIESRTPFSDDINLIEYIFSIPSVYKINGGWSKLLLRKAMKDIVPSTILNRTDKMGFSTPEFDWLSSENLLIKKRINELYDNEIIKIDDIMKDWDFLIKNPKSLNFLWKYLNYLIWKNLFF